MQRCFHILNQLAKKFRLTVIIMQDRESFLLSAKDFPSISKAVIYSTKDHPPAKDIFSILPLRLKKTLRYRWQKKTLNGPADDLFLAYYPLLQELLQRENFDIAVMENLASLNLVPLIKKYNKKIKIVYDAHNVDTNLAEEAILKGEMSAWQGVLIKKRESNLYKTVEAVITCSEHDRKIYLQMNNGQLNTATIPNGVAISFDQFNKSVYDNKPNFILFCGTLWSLPNAEGLNWFCSSIWPGVRNVYPNLRLIILGSGELPEKYVALENVEGLIFTGTVADVKEWYHKACISVVPLLTGSGTRLKILEAFGLGIPVISTSKGAEGIEYTEGENLLIADSKEDFLHKTLFLLANKTDRIKIANEAFEFAKRKYDWEIIGNELAHFLNHSLDEAK